MKSLSLLLIIILFYSCETSPCGNIGFKAVCVTIENKSGTEIKYIELKHKNGKENLQMIGAGESGYISYESAGEDAYQLKIGFITGKELETEVYTEGGYEIHHKVSADKIETKY